MNSSKVGEIIRIEWDQDTGQVRLVMEITDPAFKIRVLHNKDYADIISIKGKDAVIVATKEDK